LALWVFSEATAATNSSRYRAAAEKLATGLTTSYSNGNIDSDSAMWSLMALASSQKAGININSNTLARFASAINSDRQSHQIDRALASSLAGSKMSAEQRSLAIKDINAFQPQLNDQRGVERGVIALFAARLIDATAAVQLERRMFTALGASQSANGKEAGSFVLADKQPVADSARVYLLLSVLNGHWSITK